jgi:HD-GYP domain-containing protein (c-di-GMP phosphodiesterase class II)
VVDVFDALTSKRPYKEPMTLAEALSIIERDAGQHFDPLVVAVYIKIAPGLYTKAVQVDDAELRQGMRMLLSRYFKTETAPEEGAAFVTTQSVI